MSEYAMEHELVAYELLAADIECGGVVSSAAGIRILFRL